MRRLIFQVAVGKPSKLYEHCIESVASYATRIRADHIVLREPKYRIKPDLFNMNRSRESYEKYGGYLPIYEKEVAFDHLEDYDQIAIIDADIYVRPSTPNIFEDFGEDKAIGAVIERNMPITTEYFAKIQNYSYMQYDLLHRNKYADSKPNEAGYEFANMGMMVINSKKFLPYLNGQTGKQFIERAEFKDFVDGVGNWKWSTDQTLLNAWIKKYNVPFKKMHWKWNGLYTANTHLDQCHFVHFFLKDKLPDRGENIASLMKGI